MICLAVVGGLPDMPDLPDMMSGNCKRMTFQDGRPDASKPPHLPRMEAAGRAWTPGKASRQGKKAVRCGARLPMPPTGRIRPMPFHPSRMVPHEVGRARHARHAPDIGKAMSGRKKR